MRSKELEKVYQNLQGISEILYSLATADDFSEITGNTFAVLGKMVDEQAEKLVDASEKVTA